MLQGLGGIRTHKMISDVRNSSLARLSVYTTKPLAKSARRMSRSGTRVFPLLLPEAGSSGSGNREPIIRLHEAIWRTEDGEFSIRRRE